MQPFVRVDPAGRYLDDALISSAQVRLFVSQKSSHVSGIGDIRGHASFDCGGGGEVGGLGGLGDGGKDSGHWDGCGGEGGAKLQMHLLVDEHDAELLCVLT